MPDARPDTEARPEQRPRPPPRRPAPPATQPGHRRACCSPSSASPPSCRSAPTTSTTATPRCASRTSSTCSPVSPVRPSAPAPRSTGSSRPSATCSPTPSGSAPRSRRPSSRSTPSTSWPGWCPVTGPGIRITITEQTGPVDIDSVLDTVEELRSAGAEAMQFNGQVRVIAQTSLEDAVGGFSVDGTLVTSPYVIDVIGDPHTLTVPSSSTRARPPSCATTAPTSRSTSSSGSTSSRSHESERPEFAQAE